MTTLTIRKITAYQFNDNFNVIINVYYLNPSLYFIYIDRKQ
jgi:hypothetical protein